MLRTIYGLRDLASTGRGQGGQAADILCNIDAAASTSVIHNPELRPYDCTIDLPFVSRVPDFHLQTAEHFSDEIPLSPSTTRPSSVQDDYWTRASVEQVSVLARIDTGPFTGSGMIMPVFNPPAVLGLAPGEIPAIQQSIYCKSLHRTGRVVKVPAPAREANESTEYPLPL